MSDNYIIYNGKKYKDNVATTIEHTNKRFEPHNKIDNNTLTKFISFNNSDNDVRSVNTLYVTDHKKVTIYEHLEILNDYYYNIPIYKRCVRYKKYENVCNDYDIIKTKYEKLNDKYDDIKSSYNKIKDENDILKEKLLQYQMINQPIYSPRPIILSNSHQIPYQLTNQQIPHQIPQQLTNQQITQQPEYQSNYYPSNSEYSFQYNDHQNIHQDIQYVERLDVQRNNKRQRKY
jgi:hypothetical protein